MEDQLPSNDMIITHRQFNLDLQRGRKYLSPLSAATLQVVNFAVSQVQPLSVEYECCSFFFERRLTTRE